MLAAVLNYLPMAKLREGKIYTVKDLHTCICGNVSIHIGSPSVSEHNICSRCHNCYLTKGKGFLGAWRFRPIEDSFGQQIASEIEEEINQEQLVIK